MRRIASLLMATTTVGIIGSAASAADLPIKSALIPAPVYNWTGCYIGAQLGGGVENDSWASESGYNENSAGVIFGGQVGCNYQTGWQIFGGAVVVGVEGEGFWSGIGSSHTDSEGTGSDSEGFTYKSSNNWDFDIAARFGLAFDRTLIYTKAGAVWGGFSFSETEFRPGFSSTANGSATLPGIILGVGVEYAFLPNWTAKLEYDWMAFAQKTVNFTCTTTCPDTEFNSFSETIGANKQIIKLGVNYKFY